MSIHQAQRSIPLAVPNVGPKEVARVAEAVASGWVSSVGPEVEEFEAGVARVSGTKKGVAVASGTMGLHLALIAAGVKPGDIVISPSFSFAATANAICHAGAIPAFVDIEPDTWTMCPADTGRLIREDFEQRHDGLFHRTTGRRLAAIMPVYTNGTPALIDEIAALGRENAVPVVADAAAAIGALYKNAPIGSLVDLTVYSFNGNKTITTGAGGAVVGEDAALIQRVRHLATTARVGTGYDHDQVGYNYRMSNIEAALGCVQLERLPEFLAAKGRIRARYEAAFDGVPSLTPFPDPQYAQSTHWFSGIRVDPSLAGTTVPDMVKELNARGVGVRTFWKPMHLQPHFREMPRTSLSFTDSMWEQVLPLPCSTSLSAEDQDYVVDCVKDVLRRVN